jgi:putative chitinase
MFDREIYFDKVRAKPFNGSLTQQQVDGQSAIIDRWEAQTAMTDLRWLAYMLATTFHETAATMWPITEYGSQSYLQSKPYYPYIGRGFVQLTWEDNYRKATSKLGLSGSDDLVAYPDRALDLDIASDVMFYGMAEGWFTGKKLSQYFSASKNDPVNARAIINADVSTMGKKVAGYHDQFLAALNAAWVTAPPPDPEPEPEPEVETETVVYHVTITKPKGAEITVSVAKQL